MGLARWDAIGELGDGSTHDRSLPETAEPSLVEAKLSHAVAQQLRRLQDDRLAGLATLAGGVAQEIDDPLTFLMLNTELIARELESLVAEERAAHNGILAKPLSERLLRLGQALALIRSGAERVNRIVEDLKTFSRGSDDAPSLVDVRFVLDAAIRLARSEIEGRARFVRQYGDVPLVSASEASLGDVFYSLVLNAAQSIPRGNADANEIRITTRTDRSGRAIVELRDTGAGIAPQILRRVFDPFFSTWPPGSATGLGLSVCHGTLTSLGGEVSVESEPGEGSVFCIALPAAHLPHAAGSRSYG